MNTRSKFSLTPPRVWQRAAVAVAICCGLLGAATLRAQSNITFDNIFGNSGWEAGYNRILPVTGTCASTVKMDGDCNQSSADSNGYTTTPSSGAGSDVFIVRLNSYGVKIWERVYDIGGQYNHDTAWAVVETNDGFYITGTTEQGTGGGKQLDIFLLKINGFVA